MSRFFLSSFCLVGLWVVCEGMDNLRVAFQWKQLDFNFTSEEERQEAINSREFIQENNLPLGLEVYGERLFVTVPRWKAGVAASLAYINLTDPMDSPLLNPYPNWEAHRLPRSSNDPKPQIVSPFRMRADQCGRLWVVDTGIAEILEDTKAYSPPQLIVYDLNTDQEIRRFVIPKHQIKEDSFFANIAVEDQDCENSFAYIADLGAPAIVVYSWSNDSSWRIKHHYFNIDPLAGEFNVSGITFEWTDGVFGIALSAPDSTGYSTLYFHPLTSTREFAVSTRILRNPELAGKNFHEFRVLGSRGPKGQSSVSFLDKETGVLFYALVNLNAIACWRTSNPSYTMESQGRVYMNNTTMVFPNDIKVDAKGNLWVLSDRLPKFMYESLDPEDVNFRVLTASVKDAIMGTACDSKLVVNPEITRRMKIGPSFGDNTSKAESGAKSFGVNVWLCIVFVYVAFGNYY